MSCDLMMGKDYSYEREQIFEISPSDDIYTTNIEYTEFTSVIEYRSIRKYKITPLIGATIKYKTVLFKKTWKWDGVKWELIKDE